VRSPAHFRASYAPIAARIFLRIRRARPVLNMRRIPWTKVTRPIYPLDLVNGLSRVEGAARRGRAAVCGLRKS
jgi:microcystin degradation protein MlrC